MLWERLKKCKVDIFLYTIIGLIAVSPFFPAYTDKETFPFAVCFYALSVVLILGMLVERWKIFLILASFYLGLCLLNLFVYYTRFPWKESLDIFSSIMHCLVLAILLQKLASFLLKVKQVSGEHVKAGIAVYFLMGLLWGALYRLIFYFDPSSFVSNNPHGVNLFYFSYVTLATLGYGDILPTSKLTQMLAVLEAMLGQVYIAVFISRLMGFRIAHELNAAERA